MRISVLAAWMAAALLMGVGSAFAFQEEPAAPMPEATTPAVQAVEPSLQLQTPSPTAPERGERKGAKVFGFSLLPKLDFGLELLYSDQSNAVQQLPQTQLEEQNDLTVLGKVKRQF